MTGKRIISILSCIIFIYTIMAHPISAFADTQIDYETYSQKIKEKYAEFGINLETQEIDNKFIYTEEQLNRELEKISENGPQYASNYIHNVLSESDISIMPSAMYGTVSAQAESYLFQPDLFISGTAKIRTTASIYVDLQRNSIIKGYSPTLEVREALGGYADYVRLIDYTTRIDNSSTNIKNHFITYFMTIELKVEYNIGGGAIGWSKEERSHVETLHPFK